MLSLKVIKNRFLLTFLYFNGLLMRIKVFLGILKIKYGIVGYFEHKGVAMSHFIHSEERLKASQEYDRFRPDDVIVATFAKAGTHFVCGIIASIYREGGLIAKSTADIPFIFEFATPRMFQMLGGGAHKGVMANVDNALSPRVIPTHLPWNLLPQKVKEGKVKVIHCMRNPKDVLCSAYPFFKAVRVLEPQMSFSDFTMQFIAGNVFQGDYFHYLKEWYPYRKTPNLLNVQFEDMKEDLEGNVRRMAEFLEVELTDEQINRVVSGNTFEKKKKEMGRDHIMYRQGKSGGWKCKLTVEQNEMLDERIQRELAGMDDLKIKYD